MCNFLAIILDAIALSVDGFAAWQSTLQLNSITLDDGRETQNSNPALHPNGLPFTLDNRFRGGDLVSAVTGVMDYEFSKYRIQPTQGAIYTPANPRPDSPELTPGDLTIASFNVLNYFTTIDTGTFICGPSGDMECRGADTPDELTRQRAKILAALSGIDADIFGIMEIENDREGESPDYAVADLVAGLNAEFGAGTFSYIPTGAIGTDAIKQAIIYKPAKVTPVNTFKLLTSAVDSRFIDTLNRPVLAQVFEDNLTGKTFVVAVNHLKSKGSACEGDPDMGDGQGNCNLTRKAAAQALVDWLANPAYFPDVENALIIGDLNSYDHEDPIDMIKLGADDTADTDDDFLDMMAELRGESAYGYVYDSQIGYLDYALANETLAERIVDVNFWHINADEPDLIDYDMTFKQGAQDALYAPDAFRSSDHDPVVISLSFNAAPVANNMSINTGIGEPVQFTLAAYDPDGDSLTAEIISGPGWGQVSLNGIEVTYTPSEGFHGPDSFRYRVSDGLAQSNEATVVINVLAVANRAPVANNTRVSTTEDLAVQFILNANDPDGDPLTALISIPAHGQISMSGIEVTYTPDANYNGSDSFTYKVSDGELWSDTATVDITVTPVNDAPVANDMTETTAEDTAKTITLDATDIDSNTLTTEILSNPVHGEVSVSGLVVIYTPNANYNGLDSFTYKVSDGELESDAATVNITVTPVNDAPMANDMTETTAEDTAKVITLTVSDSDGDTLTAEILSNPTHGEVSVSGLVVTYTPDADYNGPDSFTYKVNDGELESDTATVSITVTSVNDAPVASDMTETTAEDTAKTITLDANDIDGDALTAEILSNPTHGEVSVSGLGVTYTPDADYNGPDSFTYKVSDGELESDAATVNITVTPVNDAPVASDMTETTAEDTAKAITVNVSDIDGDPLTADILSNPTHGEVSVSGIVVTYTPDANYNGPDSFTYKVSDSELWSDTATVDITVTPVNDAPVAESFEVELQENGSMTFTLLASDVDGDTLTFSLVSGTAHGTLNCAGVNCTYTPNPHWFGMDSFIFKANDGLLDSNEATVTLNVIPLPRIYLPIIFR